MLVLGKTLNCIRLASRVKGRLTRACAVKRKEFFLPQQVLMAKIAKRKEAGSDGDQSKKVPRLGLGSGAQVLSQRHGALPKGGYPRPDGKLMATGRERGGERFRVGSWNVGTLTGKSVEVAEELWGNGVVVGCLQETRWKGAKCRFIGGGDAKYKVYWMGNKGGMGGVGIAVAENWVDKVIEVVRVCDRIMMVMMAVGKVICKIISAYAPQAGGDERDKVEFFDRLSEVMLKVKDKEWVVVGGDFNGHVGEGVGDFRGMHGGHGVGRRNAEGVRLLEFCEAHELSIINTFFRKAERHRITYRSGEESSQTDYFLMKGGDRKFAEDCKVLRGEYQHSLLVAVLRKCKLGIKVVSSCRPRRRVWMLRKRENKEKFEARVKEKWMGCGENAEATWTRYKRCVLEAADEVCGWTKGGVRRSTTWWWNEDVKRVVRDKRNKFKAMLQRNTEESKEAYRAAKHEVRKEVARAMGKATHGVMEKLEGGMSMVQEGKRELFRMARQQARERMDIVGGHCIRDEQGIGKGWRI